MTDPKPNVLVELTISAPIDTVWKAVRDPEQITQWFGWESETLAEEIALRGQPSAGCGVVFKAPARSTVSAVTTTRAGNLMFVDVSTLGAQTWPREPSQWILRRRL